MCTTFTKADWRSVHLYVNTFIYCLIECQSTKVFLLKMNSEMLIFGIIKSFIDLTVDKNVHSSVGGKLRQVQTYLMAITRNR